MIHLKRFDFDIETLEKQNILQYNNVAKGEESMRDNVGNNKCENVCISSEYLCFSLYEIDEYIYIPTCLFDSSQSVVYLIIFSV